MASAQAAPSELLSSIFKFALDQPPSRLRTSQLLAQHRARVGMLVKLSLVCKKWQSTVLGDGTLWETLPVHMSRADCQESTMTVLERSKRTMLDVSIIWEDDLNSPCEAIFSKISKNFDRIKSLHFVTASLGTLHNLCTPAPNLEMLEIFTAEQPTELEFLFGGNLPALQSLALAGLPSWPLGLFSNLKDLCLVLPPSNPTVKVSSLIDIMSRSPGLKQIKMSGFLSLDHDSPPSSLVCLPNLRKLTMHDCDSVTVLSHMIIPGAANIKIIINHRRMRTAMHLPSCNCHILSSVPENMSTLGFLTESAMFVLRQNREAGFGIGFYQSRSSLPSLRVLDLSASISPFARQSIEVLASHQQHFRNIKDLSIVLSAGAAVRWSRLLHGFRRLERLSVAAHHASSILSALVVLGQDGRPICPALRQLDIHEKGCDTIALDRERMVEFFTARTVLHCSTAEVTIHWSGGRKTWKCRALGGRTVVKY